MDSSRRRVPRRALVPAAALPLLAFGACGDGGGVGEGEPARDSIAVTVSPAPPPPLPAGESDGAIGVRVERTGRLALRVDGRTALSGPVQVSVEDGHEVLFGPTEVAVEEGRFRVELAMAPSPRPVVFVYVSDPAGRHQTVVPVGAVGTVGAAGPSVE